ncbi:hypothetical protein FJY94_06945 [Candidatus Kaiserbacteria bacterium]|nr:hypothetical protein [Candidatus Kaiserbacteria bacterium]
MGRGKSKASLKLIEASSEILKEIHPASVRAVCYRLFTMGLIPNMGITSTNKVGRQLTDAREKGWIPWEWVVDETREAERASTWSSPDQIIDLAVRGYRRDYWQDQPHWVEVWSEKGTVRGTLASVLNQFGVTFRVMHGYGSATAIYDIAAETVRAEKPLTVFYVGDFDCSGMNMSEVDLPRRLVLYGGAATIRRIALTHEDVGPGSELPGFDAATKKKDPRYRWFVDNYGGRCWELDAMSPVTLRQRVENAIVGMLNTEAWERAVEVEQAEVASMRDFASAWQQSISRQASKYLEGDAP